MPRLPAFLGNSTPLGLTIRRFPGPVLLAVAFTILAILKNHGHDLHGTIKDDIPIALAISFFWALSTNLAARARRWPRWLEATLALAATALTFAALLTTPDTVFMPALMLGEAAILTTLAAASPGLRHSDNDALWRFTAAALEGAAIALVAALVVAIGMTLLLTSVEYLFGLRANGRLIPDVWMISFGLLWPLRALGTLPRPEDAPETYTLQFNAALPFILDWALVPIWIAYLAVLYAYAAKILIEGSLPRGNVATMVHGFGALGVAVWLIAWSRRDSGPALTRLFQRRFWWTLFVPLALLAIGIAARVVPYGWTEPRYMVAAGGVWLALMALVYIAFPRRAPLALAPLSLALISIVAAFGPWSAVSVSVRDQHARLTELLARNQILVDGRVVPAATPTAISSSDVERIASSLQFLTSHSRFDLLNPWFAEKAPQTRTDIMTAFGLRDVDPTGAFGDARRNITTVFGLQPWMRDRAPPLLDVAGYDLIGQVRFFLSDEARTITALGSDKAFLLRLDRAAARLTVETPDGRAAAFDLSPALTQLLAATDPKSQITDPPELALLTATGALRAKLVIQSAAMDKAPDRFAIRELSVLIAISDRAP